MTFTTIDPSLTPSVQVNLLDNGGFEIWQRGTTFTNAASGSYTADRWKVFKNVGGTTTVGVAQSSSTIDNGQFSLQMTLTTAQAGGSAVVQQILEPSLSASLIGKTVTLSIRVLTNVGAAINAGIGGNITPTALSAYASAGSWQTLTVSQVVSAGENALFVNIGCQGTAVNSVTYIDSAILVIGPNPASFSQLNPAIDLLRCQRYYEASNWNDLTTMIFAGGGVQALWRIDYKVTKRTSPTVTVTPINIQFYNQPTQGNGTAADTGNWNFSGSVDSSKTDAFTVNPVRNTTQTAFNLIQFNISWTSSADL